MELLDSPIRGYAWGSRTAIATIQGRAAPTVAPEAELWMGAHPDSPSTLTRDGVTRTVGEAVRDDPAGMLGTAVSTRFGSRLPFMLKVLAADSSLSLQAHPDAEMAASRYAEEDAAGLVRGSAERNYVDPYPKPELLVAIDEFDTLCGFREPRISAGAIEALGVPALDRVVARLRTGTPSQRLRGAVEDLLRWPEPERAAVVADVVAAVERIGPTVSRDSPVAPGTPDFVVELGARFPADMGVVVTLLLNHATLAADEAIWMPAGNLHAYLRGTGMEVLAASDNVLRGGLTGKRVDVDELLRVLRFEVLDAPVVKPVTIAPGVLTWPVPVPEFVLYRVEVRGDGTRMRDVDLPGPRIVFCAAGRVVVDDGAAITLRSGQAALGPAGRPLTLRGDGVGFVASTGALGS